MTGWKQWGIGEVVEAGDLQTYVQDQTVQNYATSAARGSALGTAVAEGMVSYLQDSNSVQVYDGSDWQAIAPISHNYIINGAFDIWQRGTSFTSDGFTADRFKTTIGVSTTTTTQESFTPNDLNIVGFGDAKYFHRFSISAANGQSRVSIEQSIEDVQTLAGQDVTISFYAKADSSRSLGNLLAVQSFGSGGSANVDVFPDISSVNLTTSWQRFTVNASIPSIAGKTVGTGSKLFLRFDFTPADGAVYDLWGVQLEAGSVATPFKRHAPSLQGELAACQRYFERLNLGRSSVSYQGSSVTSSMPYATRKRTAPSITTNATNANYGSVWSFAQSGVSLSSKSGTATIIFDGSDAGINHMQLSVFGATYSPAPNALESLSGLYFDISAEL